MTKNQIAAEITSRVNSSKAPNFSAWRIGITHDLAERLKYWRDTEKKDVQHWKNWTADSLPDAQDIESFFINQKGMTGGTGGDMDAAKTTYVYIF